MATLDESHVEKKFRNLVTSQESIQSLSMWVVHHKAQHEKIVNIWFNVLKKSKLDHRLTLFYLANDIVQTCRRKHAVMYKDAFKEVMKDATLLVRDNAIKPPIERIFTIWKERGIYDAEFADELVAIINNTKVRATMNSKLLSEFQPLSLMERVITLKRFEDEIELKRRQLRNLRLDASSIEAVKQLKDRTHGGEFCAEFESACTKMEDYVKSLEKEISDRVTMIEMLEQSELYYDAQYGEAKIVANAYKNFGTRVNNLKRKLDDKKQSLPDSVSPVGSPLVDAPSPSPVSSPEEHMNNRLESEAAKESAYHKENASSEEKSHHHHHHHRHRENSHHDQGHYNKQKVAQSEAYDYTQEYQPDSPIPPGLTSPIPPGVTTPEYVPQQQQYDMNTEAIDMEMSDEEEANPGKESDKVQVGRYGRREATNVTPSYPGPIPSVTDIHMHDQRQTYDDDMDMSPKSDDDFAGPQGSPLVLDHEDKKSAYIPSVAKGATTSFLDEILKATAATTSKKDNEDGGSTPVMDEFESTSNGGGTSENNKQEKTKSKQNPIDFLTQLIGQTKKTNSNSSASFFENLSMLTKTVKTQYDDKNDENDQPQTTADSWAAWKAQNAPPPPLESPAQTLAPPLPQPPSAPPTVGDLSPEVTPPPKIHPTLLPPPTPPFQSPMPPPPFPPPPSSDMSYPAPPVQRQDSGGYPGHIAPPSGYSPFGSGQQNSYSSAPANYEQNSGNFGGGPHEPSYRPTTPGQQGFPPLPPAPPGLRFPPPPMLPDSSYPQQLPMPPMSSSSTPSPTYPAPANSQSSSYPQHGQSTTTPPSPYPPPLAPPGPPLPPRPPYTPNNYPNQRFPPPPPHPNMQPDHNQSPFQPPSPNTFGGPRTPSQAPPPRPFMRPPPTPPISGGPSPFSQNIRPPISSQSNTNWDDGGPPHPSVHFRLGNQRSNLTTIKTVDDSEFVKHSSEDQPSWSADMKSPPVSHPFSPRRPTQPPKPIMSLHHGEKDHLSNTGEGQQEFIEKLKRKSTSGDMNSPPNHNFGDQYRAPFQPNYGSNLRTLTQVTMDMSSGNTGSNFKSRAPTTETTNSALDKGSQEQHEDSNMLVEQREINKGMDKTVIKQPEENKLRSKDNLNSSFDEKSSESDTEAIGQHVGGFIQRLRAETEKDLDKLREETEYSDYSEDTEESMSPFKSHPPPLLRDGDGGNFSPIIRPQFRMRGRGGGGIQPQPLFSPNGGPPRNRMPFRGRPPGPFRGTPPRGHFGPPMGFHRGGGNHPGDLRAKRPPPLLGRHGGGGNRPFFPHPRY